MKWLTLLLLLAGCGSRTPSGTNEEADIPPDPSYTAENLLASRAEDPARLKARVDAAMAAILRDPHGAKYRNVRSGAEGSACGEIALKPAGGRSGGFLPFVVSPEGAATISSTPRISFDDPSDPFPDFYMRWCATPDELKTLAPHLSALRGSAGSGTPVLLPDMPGLGAPAANGRDGPAALPAGAPPSPPAQPASPPAGTQPSKDDSFFNAVVPGREPAPGK